MTHGRNSKAGLDHRTNPRIRIVQDTRSCRTVIYEAHPWSLATICAAGRAGLLSRRGSVFPGTPIVNNPLFNRDAATILREFSEDRLSYSQEFGVRHELNLINGTSRFVARPERFGSRNPIDPASQSPEKPA
jgi:hypothetical protein